MKSLLIFDLIEVGVEGQAFGNIVYVIVGEEQFEIRIQLGFFDENFILMSLDLFVKIFEFIFFKFVDGLGKKICSTPSASSGSLLLSVWKKS